nr:MAG TPA: hypothetical protein [Caudoviricetes sp.]
MIEDITHRYYSFHFLPLFFIFLDGGTKRVAASRW